MNEFGTAIVTHERIEYSGIREQIFRILLKNIECQSQETG